MAELAAASEATNAALADLVRTNESLIQVAQYCRDAYTSSPPEGREEMMAQTTKYTSDALQNVVYHVHNVAVQITAYIEAEDKAIDNLNSKMLLMSERMKNCQSEAGSLYKQQMLFPMAYQREFPQARKLQEHELPPSHKPPEAWERKFNGTGCIDYSSLDSVGCKGE